MVRTKTLATTMKVAYSISKMLDVAAKPTKLSRQTKVDNSIPTGKQFQISGKKNKIRPELNS